MSDLAVEIVEGEVTAFTDNSPLTDTTQRIPSAADKKVSASLGSSLSTPATSTFGTLGF